VGVSEVIALGELPQPVKILTIITRMSRTPNIFFIKPITSLFKKYTKKQAGRNSVGD